MRQLFCNKGGTFHAALFNLQGRHGMNRDCGLLVNSSRGIIYASKEADFAERAGEEAAKLQQQMAGYL